MALNELQKERMANGICIHNFGINCRSFECDGCGWDPDVAKKRLDALKEKNEEE
jgi:hypothetical protein